MDEILKHQPMRDESIFDLNSSDSEMLDALLMIVGVSRPIDLE